MSHILMLLVVCQSTIAVADLHQSHQSGQDHIKLHHVDGLTDGDESISSQADIQIDIDIESNTTVSYDCQHCGHCHSVSCYYLLKDDTVFIVYHDNDTIFENLNLFSTRIISPDLRPPIV
ncbi:MAG: hypothetical protein L3J83_06975 [Proteobacteria bacterium]|nr:hypothetical protein [Pseudomonadota bacterium]